MSIPIRTAAIAVGGVLAIGAAFVPSQEARATVPGQAGASESASPGTESSIGSFIVTYADGADPSSAQVAAAASAALPDAATADVTTATKLSDTIATVQLDDTLDQARQADFVAALEDRTDVVAVEPNTILHPLATDDPAYGALWNLRSGSSYGVDAEDAWPVTTGTGSVIAVLDTGVTTHPDLSSALLTDGGIPYGHDFVTDDPTHGVFSHDGDGWDADPTDPGDYCTVPGEQAKSSWHGTHVSGIAAAAANNGTGGAGVAPGASIETVRVMGGCGGATSDLIAGIRWAAGLSVPGVAANAHKASVINLSLGGDGQCQASVQQAIDEATGAGSIVVVAAGNSGQALASSTPANCQNVIRVTASTSTGTLAGYSDSGSTSLPATVAAPGGTQAGTCSQTSSNTQIYSTINTGTKEAIAASYGCYVGTSMAAPHVSAIVALLTSLNPALSLASVQGILTASATPFPAGASYQLGGVSYPCTTTACGAGVANAAAAVSLALRPAVAGVLRVAKTLGADTANWPSGTALSYQWYRNGKAIKGATKPTYKTVAADNKTKISVGVTGAVGSAPVTRRSVAMAVKAGLIRSTGKPTVSGKAAVGVKLRVSRGSWSTSIKPSYRWYRNGAAIKGITTSSYRLRKSDKGTRITVKVKAIKTGYTSVLVTVTAAKTVR